MDSERDDYADPGLRRERKVPLLWRVAAVVGVLLLLLFVAAGTAAFFFVIFFRPAIAIG